MRLVFAIPGDLSAPTGGYAYARRVLALLPGLGVEVRHVPLPDTFPNPTAFDLAESARRLALAAPEEVILADGLAYGAFDAGVLAAIRAPVAALVHHPLALEAGTPPERAAALVVSERAALAHARAVIATSRPTADILIADYAVAPAVLSVAEPGVDPAPRATGGRGGPIGLLAVGAVSPRKAYGVLIAALARLSDRDWHLTICGATDRAPEEAARLVAAIGAAGLQDRVTFTGALDDRALASRFASADIFVMSSLFEGYGMAVTEALARGLPIVSSTGGALASVVPDEAALKVAPGDAAALGDALARMIGDGALRRAKADAAWAHAGRLPRWEATAAGIAAAVRGIAR